MVQEPVHDVAVISVAPLFTSVFQGWPNPINVDVQNQGNFTENFTVSLYYNDTHVTTSPITVTNLPSGAIKTLKFCWVTKNVPLGNYTIKAVASTVPGETDTADNTMADGTVTILAPPQFYWKDGFCDYAPSGMPDFDQKQWGTYNWTDQWGAWSHCGPVAVANSLWWLDSKFEPAQPPISPPAISDGFPLVSSYIAGLDDHDPANVQPLIEHLAYLMDTQGPAGVGLRTGLAHSGTYVNDMEAGLTQYLSWTGVNPKGDVNGDGIVNQTDVNIVTALMGSTPGNAMWNMAADIFPVTVGWPVKGIADNKIDANDLALVTANLGKTGLFYEHTVNNPDFNYIEQEVEKSQDVVLLVGYWYYNPSAPPGQRWYREGGHYVTVAGVNSTQKKIAISDPCYDAFENGNITEGRVPIPHVHPVPEPPYVTHNDAAFVSHDIYNVALISDFGVDPNPNGTWTLVNYVGWKPTPPYFSVIEAAVITSPLAIQDIAVKNLTACYGATVIHGGEICYINVTVENLGTTGETFTLTVYWNTTNLIDSTSVSLASGNTDIVPFQWNTSGLTEYSNYTLSAYATHVAGETNTTNNNFVDGTIILVHLGDVDANHKVEIKDIFAIAKAYGSSVGQPKYNPNLDINNDGKIDIKDIFATAKNYGWSG